MHQHVQTYTPNKVYLIATIEHFVYNEIFGGVSIDVPSDIHIREAHV